MAVERTADHRQRHHPGRYLCQPEARHGRDQAASDGRVLSGWVARHVSSRCMARDAKPAGTDKLRALVVLAALVSACASDAIDHGPSTSVAGASALAGAGASSSAGSSASAGGPNNAASSGSGGSVAPPIGGSSNETGGNGGMSAGGTAGM